jgi:hypothetical protein
VSKTKITKIEQAAQKLGRAYKNAVDYGDFEPMLHSEVKREMLNLIKELKINLDTDD